MLTFCLRPPERKGPNFELASPLSILHDHPYGKFQHTDKGWKQVVARGWSSNCLPLTPHDLVCKRNGFVRNSEKKKTTVVEMDNTIHDVTVGWPHVQRQERSAKFLARLKIKDTCNTEKEVGRIPTMKTKKKTKLNISRAQKVKKLPTGSAHNLKSSKTVIATLLPTAVPVSSLAPYSMSSSLKKLLPNVPPSIIAQARKCTVGITPTKPFISPTHGPHFVFPPSSPSREQGSRSTPAHQLKPFSIPVKKLPLSLMPLSSSRVKHVTNSE